MVRHRRFRGHPLSRSSREIETAIAAALQSPEIQKRTNDDLGLDLPPPGLDRLRPVPGRGPQALEPAVKASNVKLDPPMAQAKLKARAKLKAKAKARPKTGPKELGRNWAQNRAKTFSSRAAIRRLPKAEGDTPCRLHLRIPMGRTSGSPRHPHHAHRSWCEQGGEVEFRSMASTARRLVPELSHFHEDFFPAFFKGAQSLSPPPPGHVESRKDALPRHPPGRTRSMRKQVASWVRQAAKLPGWLGWRSIATKAVEGASRGA